MDPVSLPPDDPDPVSAIDVTIDVADYERLAAALLRANQESAELEQFVYSAGHDLQEPLRTVTNFTQLLAREAKGQLGSEADRYIAFILDGTARMRALIDGLLALARVTGSAGSGTGPVSCAEIVADCIRALRGSIEESGAVINFGELPDVVGDGVQLTQLFLNLLSNAIKFRKPGLAPKIEISAVRIGAEWQFCVRDNGMGFDPAHAQALFVPFRRLHGREIPGAGIGLALCRKIVGRHGGKIQAEGVEGEGAAFRFTLPDTAATGMLTR